MLEINRKIYMFNSKEIWFADYPFDVEGYDSATFMECKNKVDRAGFTRREHTTLVIDLTQNLDTIWRNMGKKSCRYEINRAKREEVIVKINQDSNEFYQMDRSFRAKKGLGTGSLYHPEFMRKYGTLFTAEVTGETIAGQFYLEDENNIRWLVGASKRLEVDRDKAIVIGCANRLIIWEAIKYAKEKGIKEFDFGGYYTGGDTNDPRYSINIFKQSFGGELTTLYNYDKVYSRAYKWASSLYRLIAPLTRAGLR